MKAIVLIENHYEDSELIYPYYRLQEAGFEVDLVGPEADTVYTGKNGVPMTSDLAAEDVDVSEYDVVVIPGGYSPDHMRRHEAMVDIVRDADAAGKTVAAICHAGWLLAEAGIVKGRRITSFFAIKTDMVNAGGDWVDEEVVVDGNLVTSRHPGDLPAFTRAILEMTRSAQAAKAS